MHGGATHDGGVDARPEDAQELLVADGLGIEEYLSFSWWWWWWWWCVVILRCC